MVLHDKSRMRQITSGVKEFILRVYFFKNLSVAPRANHNCYVASSTKRKLRMNTLKNIRFDNRIKGRVFVEIKVLPVTRKTYRAYSSEEEVRIKIANPSPRVNEP